MIPTPAGYLGARLRTAARRGGPRAGYYRFAAALVTDSPECLDRFGAAVSEFPSRLQESPAETYHPGMAKKFIEYLVDDLTGDELDPGTGETVRFGFAGRSYEIDLSVTNAAALAEFMRPYIKAARPDSGTPAKSTAKKSHRPADEARNGAIRKWAAGQGIELPTRGRIPAEVSKAFDAANPAE